MSFRSLLIQQATVVRRTAATADRYGNPTYTWADDETYPARLEQLSAEERIVTEDRQVIEWRVFLPASADLTAADRVRVDGTTFEVFGEPARPYGRRSVHHVEAELKVVSGGV